MLASDLTIPLQIGGVGIIVYSPANAAHIPEGEDYLLSNYTTVADVQRHLLGGSIIGFGTGSPGKYLLRLRAGYPEVSVAEQHAYRLRLAVCCTGGKLVFRDLYSLIAWNPDYPPEQAIPLADGYYHLTLLTSRPVSGNFGDNQEILQVRRTKNCGKKGVKRRNEGVA